MPDHPGERFCARIKKLSEDRFDLYCVIRVGDPLKGPTIPKVVDGNPPFPLTSDAQARDRARQFAELACLSFDGIVWE
ncbi:MAG: hypothetical protein ABSE20_17550 [Acetobacteraceae bacterium]|jgi:hypothetical protein